MPKALKKFYEILKKMKIIVEHKKDFDPIIFTLAPCIIMLDSSPRTFELSNFSKRLADMNHLVTSFEN